MIETADNSKYELLFKKMYLMTWAPSVDSDQPVQKNC